ncbi:MAG: glycosyltransferase family 39 protein [Planctomycetes bacterium]|nr:glycosyltransferase family 39 protein [Planctomycetota bacterium]
MQMKNLIPRRIAASSPALNPGIELLLAGVIAVLAVFPWLGDRDLWTAGEGRVAQVAQQMLVSNTLEDYIIPRIGDDVRLQKPPLAYWLVVAASLPEGRVTEFTGRLPSAIAAVLAALLLCRWGREVIGGYGGLLAAVAFITTGSCWWQARNSTIEMTHLFFVMLALYSWWRYDRSVPVYQTPPASEKPKTRWLLSCYLALGLAALDKGPIAPPLVLLIIAAFLLFSKRNPFKLRVLDHLLGLLVFCIIAVPWILLVLKLNGSQETLDLWFYETDRFEGHDHLKDWWYFLPKILGDGQPWVLFGLGGAVAALFGSGRKKLSAKERASTLVDKRWLSDSIYFAVIWMLVALVFFSIPSSKKSYYILPIYPALALCAAWCFEAVRTSGKPRRHLTRSMVWLCQIVGVVMVLVGLALPFASEHLFEQVDKFSKYQGHTSQFAAAAAIALICGCILFWKARLRRWGAVVAWITIGTFAGFGLHTWLLPDLNAHKGDRALCESIKADLRADDRICTYFSGQAIYRFYLGRHTTRLNSMSDLLGELANLGEEQRLLLALKDTDWDDFSRSFYIAGETPEELKQLEEFYLPYEQPAEGRPTMRVYTHSGKQDGWAIILKVGSNRPNEKKGLEALQKWQEDGLALRAQVQIFAEESGKELTIIRLNQLFEVLVQPPGQGKGMWISCERPYLTKEE